MTEYVFTLFAAALLGISGGRVYKPDIPPVSKRGNRMNVIDITGLEKSYGPRTVIAGATLAVAEGEKVGVIGRNGCGKSTLLRILAGLEDSDSGSVVRKRGLVATYLPQEPELDPDRTIRQTLDGCLAEVQAKLSRFQELAHALPEAPPEEAQRFLAEQQEVQGWLDLHGAWNLDHKVAQVCDRLGITDLEPAGGEPLRWVDQTGGSGGDTAPGAGTAPARRADKPP